ncbi:MAG: hypothetical protein ABSD74_02875 [Rhizomicrobium sp.]|jgi:hypothetical protein
MSDPNGHPRIPGSPALLRAFVVGTAFQALTVGVGHFSGLLAEHEIGFLFADMMIAATVGYLYAQEVSPGYARASFGGAVSGGLCALAGIAISVPLGDLTVRTFLQRAAICVLTGGVGGIYGQLAADWRSLI